MENEKTDSFFPVEKALTGQPIILNESWVMLQDGHEEKLEEWCSVLSRAYNIDVKIKRISHA